MTNFSLAAMPESSKAKPKPDAKAIAESTARRVFSWRHRNGPAVWSQVHLTFTELVDILQQQIEDTRNE